MKKERPTTNQGLGRWFLGAAAALLVCCARPGLCMCYLADEYQGVFMGRLPATPTEQPTMAEVMVVADGIPLWGECYRKMGNSLILREREKSRCFRCLVLLVRSNNVLQIFTEGLEKCFRDEESARTTCPTEASILAHEAKEIMLYKKPNPEIVSLHFYCPINGRFKFTYSSAARERECPVPFSEFSNCPYGFSLTARFKQCSFPDEEVYYQCLGDWEGPTPDQRYLALLEGKPNAPISASNSPKYRCAMYREDKSNGHIVISLSPDSTCSTHHLVNATHGFETFSLISTIPPQWPQIVTETECRFPDWAQGIWANLAVEGSIITFKDQRNFKTQTVKCISKTSVGGPEQETFCVYARSQCGDELYTCLAMAKRSRHILEFQLGQQPSVQYNSSVCHSQQFSQKDWITVGKKGQLPDTPCPIAGEYTGLVPDTQGVCAKLASDCNNPDIMFYTASNCHNRSDVYEEREYRCLGQWDENGLTYTYTERRDVAGYQCFVGTILNDYEISIMEAEVNCMRGIDLQKFGMRMMKKGDCGTGFYHPAITEPPVIVTIPSKHLSTKSSNSSVKQEVTNNRSHPYHSPVTTPAWIIIPERKPVQPTHSDAVRYFTSSSSVLMALSCLLFLFY